jgi:hypothetical protein
MMADDTTRRDPVALFKDAFGPDSNDTRRGAALGIMMQNPSGFVSGLVELVGGFTAALHLTKISKDASAPQPLRKAAENEVMRLESMSLESKRLGDYGQAFSDKGWGEPSSRVPERVKPAMNNVQDAEMKKKYRETIIRTTYPLPPISKKEWRPTSPFLLFSLVRK